MLRRGTREIRINRRHTARINPRARHSFIEGEILNHTLARVFDVPFDLIDRKTKPCKGVPYIVLVQCAIRVSVDDELVPCGIRTIRSKSLGIG